MKTRLVITLAALAAFALSFVGCSGPQAAASGTFIAAEVVTAQILAKNPSAAPTLQAIVDDWGKFQLGKLTANDEAALLTQVVTATGQKLSPAQAALLDGSVQQILANQNATAPTPLGGAAAAIVSDVIGGVSRGLVVYQAGQAAPTK